MSVAAKTSTATHKSNRKEPKDAILRQWVMLQAIPCKPHHISTQQLRDKLSAVDRIYAVHKRTVERNLMALMSVFPALDYEITPTGNLWYWDLRNDAAPHPLAFTGKPRLPVSAANDANGGVRFAAGGEREAA